MEAPVRQTYDGPFRGMLLNLFYSVLWSFHFQARPFPCDKCNLAFKCRNGLKSHKLSVHSETKHFVCQHCGSGFSTSSGVSRHQKQNRCSGLKALGENVASRENTNTGK